MDSIHSLLDGAVGFLSTGLLDLSGWHVVLATLALTHVTIASVTIFLHRARILFVPASSDLIFPPELSQRALARFRAQGGRGEIFVIQGDGGHLDGLFGIGQAAESIRAFIESP